MRLADDELIAAKEKELRNELDDYLSSVRGIHAFAKSALWDETRREIRPIGHHSAPRSMSRPGSPDVMPDLVVQVTNDYGVIAEMKKHVHDGDTTSLDQMAKYDADLTGWWTDSGKIGSNDLVLLTYIASSTRAQDAARAWFASGKAFRRPFAIVEYSFTDGGQRWFFLRRVFGELSDREHDEALRVGKSMPEHIVEDIIAKKRFYDALPPMVHLLVLIETHIVPPLFDAAAYDTDERVLVVTVTVDEVWRRLRDDLGHIPADTREEELPKRAWVVSALEQLVAYELAKRLGGDRYALLLKRPSGKDWLNHFARLAVRSSRTKKAKEEPEDGQAPLFIESPNQS